MNKQKTRAIIAYIFSFIGGLIVLLMKDSERNTKIHAAQSITTFIAYYIIKFGYAVTPFTVPGFEYILSGMYLIIILIGIIKAYNDDAPEIPVIGDLATSIFKKQIEN